MLQTTPPQEGDAEAFKPTLFLAAPVVLDKVVAGVRAKFRALPWILRCFVDMGLNNGSAHWDKGGYGASNPLFAGFFKKKVAKALGGRVEFIGTGSAPLSAEVRRPFTQITPSHPFFSIHTPPPLLFLSLLPRLLPLQVQKFVATIFACPVRQDPRRCLLRR
jgi:hypothetical protein